MGTTSLATLVFWIAIVKPPNRRQGSYAPRSNGERTARQPEPQEKILVATTCVQHKSQGLSLFDNRLRHYSVVFGSKVSGAPLCWSREACIRCSRGLRALTAEGRVELAEMLDVTTVPASRRCLARRQNEQN